MPTLEVLAKEICGFANAEGGRLIVGVTDEGEVVGFTSAKTADDITRMLDDRCEPTPAFQIDWVSLQDKRVMVISVPQGAERPYVSNRVVYLRRGATTRGASRHELDRMTQRQSPSRFE